MKDKALFSTLSKKLLELEAETVDDKLIDVEAWQMVDALAETLALVKAKTLATH